MEIDVVHEFTWQFNGKEESEVYIFVKSTDKIFTIKYLEFDF